MDLNHLGRESPRLYHARVRASRVTLPATTGESAGRAAEVIGLAASILCFSGDRYQEQPTGAVSAGAAYYDTPRLPPGSATTRITQVNLQRPSGKGSDGTRRAQGGYRTHGRRPFQATLGALFAGL